MKSLITIMEEDNKASARRLQNLVNIGVGAEVIIRKHENRIRTEVLTAHHIATAKTTIANLRRPVRDEEMQEVSRRMHTPTFNELRNKPLAT